MGGLARKNSKVKEDCLVRVVLSLNFSWCILCWCAQAAVWVDMAMASTRTGGGGSPVQTYTHLQVQIVLLCVLPNPTSVMSRGSSARHVSHMRKVSSSYGSIHCAGLATSTEQERQDREVHIDIAGRIPPSISFTTSTDTAVIFRSSNIDLR